jgi:hypothetical protein
MYESNDSNQVIRSYQNVDICGQYESLDTGGDGRR